MKVKDIVSNVYKDITTHWKRPAQGNFVSYKELLNLALGGMGNQLTMQLVWQMALSAGNTLLGSTIGIRPIHLQYMLTVQTACSSVCYFCVPAVPDYGLQSEIFLCICVCNHNQYDSAFVYGYIF